MDAISAKKLISKKYPTARIPDRYIFMDGKYYTFIVFTEIPKSVKLHFPDRSGLGISVDEKTGEVRDFSSFELSDICSGHLDAGGKW